MSQGKVHKKSLELSKRSNGVIPFLEDEIVQLEAEIKAFRAGAVSETKFMASRLKQGVYGQRQPDAQMVRVKIPGGILTPEALDALGQFAETYAPMKKGHVTTRENIQFHHIQLENCADGLRILGDAGLSTREACGNTVRNVVGSPTAGVDADEVFDITPYLAAYVRYAVRHPLTQNFPRKFKTSFTGSEKKDTVASSIHDLSFVAQTRTEKGATKRGFRVYVGGGTSIMPRIANLYSDFVPVEDYLRVTEAIWNVFDKSEMLRKNRMMARIKVLIDRIGFDSFKDLVNEELKQIGPIDPSPLMNVTYLHEEQPPKKPETDGKRTIPQECSHWINTNTVEQKQSGYYLAYVKLPLGDIDCHQFYALAKIIRRYTGGRARSTQEQNLALRWIPKAYLYDVWAALRDIGLADAEAHTITDIVSCPGTDSCKLGITSSMGLARSIRDSLESTIGLMEDHMVRKLHIKMSGCPNGCGLHHIAGIGFHGAAMKGPGGVQLPAYEIFLGGHYGGDNIEDTRIAQRLPRVKVPSKRVASVVKDVVDWYKAHRVGDEEFYKFIERVGTKPFEEIAARYAEVGALSEETKDLYMDWEKPDIYKLERGEGECVA